MSLFRSMFITIWHVGQECDRNDIEEDSSSSSDQMSVADLAFDCQERMSVMTPCKSNFPLSSKLSEEKVRKLRLMNSLNKIQRIVDNAEMWIISSLFYMDKLTNTGELIKIEDLHW